ncbi:MAG TPA: energy-coupling factor transporter ATPase [Anaerolineales bacterium]|nr:energy-coupling factor transporter ATPase [Anaerolineales bacterium]
MPGEEVLALRKVTFAYEGDIVALRDLNLSVRKGEFVVVLGANGAGKSTLCYLISGIVPHIYGGRRQGHLTLVGIDPWDEPLYVTSQRCGVLMQDPEVQLFMPSLGAELAFGPANLGVPREEILRRSKEALTLVRLEGLEEHNPRDLSGGQKQRAALAAVLTMQPRVLVLDEPTSQLDPLGRWEVGEAIERLKRAGDLAIVMTTHESEEILHLADQVVVLERGEAVLQGSPEEVFSHPDRLEQAGVKTPALIQAQSRLVDLAPGAAALPSRVSLSLEGVADQIRREVTNRRLTVLPQALPPRQAPAPEAPVVLEARDLTFEYPGPPAVLALQDVNLQWRQGEFVGIVGQNGSGKSTLVRCLVGLLRPGHGDVLFRGKSIRGLSVGEMARRVGLVLQNPDYQLFSASCREEIAFGLRNVGVPDEQIEGAIEQALRTVGLEKQADLFPFRLSFGDRRKLAAAATMALAPEVLIMDEPTTAQDHRGRYQLADLARRFHSEQGGTVVMITHDVDLIARYAHRLIVLYRGQVLLDGPTAEVFAQVEELRKTFVVPPVAGQLAQRLTALGLPPDILTLDELFQVLVPAGIQQRAG